ncbi:hypothetical protein HDU99_008118, partial [Rhizoclosmatium hyalinum]
MSKETSDFLMAERPPSTETAVTVDSTSSASSGLTLSWKDLGYTIKDKTLLSGLNGCVEPGQVLAVMGPSGAGKSTFL